MSSNPYLEAWNRRRLHQRRAEGALARFGRFGVAAFATFLLVPLVRPVFLSFLDAPAGRTEGLEGALIRAGFALVGIVAIEVYAVLVRSPDRAVLDLLPVDPEAVVRFEVLRLARERASLIVGLAVLLGPVGWEGAWAAWAYSVVLLVGTFALALTASAAMHLLAVRVAESPRWSAVLDLFRGGNPRPQAAFLYAPGAALAAVGGIVVLAADGVGRLSEADPLGLLGLAAPFAAAALAYAALPALAKGSWARAAAVTADIDARYAVLGDTEEGRRAYLDWAARFLPASVARYALKDFRHGWRARRAWIVGAWIAGVGAALAGWAGHDRAPNDAAALVAGSVWAFATVGVLLDGDDPPFLAAWLPRAPAPRGLARAFVLAAWLQACPWLAACAVAVRHGVAAASLVVLVGLGSTVLAVAAATFCGRARAWGPWMYGPVAALAGLATAAWATGG